MVHVEIMNLYLNLQKLYLEYCGLFLDTL